MATTKQSSIKQIKCYPMTSVKVYGEGTPWKTESAMLAWIRGGIRRGLWNKSPVKLSFLNKNREQIPNPNPKGKKDTVWGARCCQCDGLFPISQIEVDHKRGENSLKSLADIASFIKAIVLVTHDDLQLICKPCHKIKSYAEKVKISFKDAYAEKEAIRIVKEKKDVQYLENNGIIPGSNQAKRRAQIVEFLKAKTGE